MVEKIIWTATARENLREIVLRIAADRPLLAENDGLELIAAAETVAEFPRIGRFVPEFEDQSLREIIKPPYRIISERFPHQPRPVIMRVWHGARGTPEIVRPPSL